MFTHLSRSTFRALIFAGRIPPIVLRTATSKGTHCRNSTLADNAMLTWGVCLFAAVVLVGPAQAQLVIEERLSLSGTVESASAGLLVVKDEKGKAHTVRVQAMDKENVPLAGGRLLRFPAEIQVTGNYDPEDLQAGQTIRFRGQVNRLGRTAGTLSDITLVSSKGDADGITVVEEAAQAADFSTCDLVCQFTRITNGRLLVQIPANNGFTRKPTLSFELADDANVSFKSNDIRRAGAGAKVTQMSAVRLNTGDLVAKSVSIRVATGTTARASVDDQLLAKYRHLSDKPQQPRLVRSPHFAFMTDVSERQARIILDKLETMAELLTKYFGRAPTGTVEGFIVRDLSGWPDNVLKESKGVAKIRAGAGICFNSSLGSQRRAVLYSCDNHGVIQHECTHGFCYLAFGSTGPTWLAEGVAEMGKYWKADQNAVEIAQVVLTYLQQTKPKKRLLEIAVPGRVGAGNWQDYAWRWALCYLLANNPNYADRFKPLAVALMEKQEGVSFAAVYGPVAKQLAFEYDLFLNTLGNGYRADLCAWQWKVKSAPLQMNQRTKRKISAAYGWQASGVTLEQGVSYDIAAVGNWSIAQDGSQYNADGDKDGRGKLVGAILKDFQLSAPFPIGKLKRFEAPSDGRLYLRCRDGWNKLADNEGELTVHFRRTPE